MNSKVALVAALIQSGGDWRTALISNWDCIGRHEDRKLLDLLLGHEVDFTGANMADASLTSPDLITPLIGGVAIGKIVAAYGAGTPYALTNAQAAIDLGTTDPAIVIDEPGSYLIQGQFHLARNGATVVAETATLKVRRTNNTAADVSVLPVYDLPASTTLTDTLGFVQIPAFLYQTPRSDDALSLFGAVSAALGAGSIDVTAIGTFLLAQRIGDATA